MAGFTKLFNSILHSTIWGECHETRIVWITMLAMADRKGEVQASIPGLARAACVTQKECETALETLAAPDPHSRTPDNEGRRIEAITGGWALLNHALYRKRLSEDERREYNRRKQAEYRQRKKAESVTKKVTPDTRTVTCVENAHSTEAEAEADKISGDKSPSSSGDDARAEFSAAWKDTSFPQPRKWTPARTRAFKARMAEPFFRDNWREALAKAKASEFCQGGFMGLDWFLKPGNFAKLIEGNYDNKNGSKKFEGKGAPPKLAPMPKDFPAFLKADGIPGDPRGAWVVKSLRDDYEQWKR